MALHVGCASCSRKSLAGNSAFVFHGVLTLHGVLSIHGVLAFQEIVKSWRRLLFFRFSLIRRVVFFFFGLFLRKLISQLPALVVFALFLSQGVILLLLRRRGRRG